jgi:glycosyltransferase 2 family protein
MSHPPRRSALKAIGSLVKIAAQRINPLWKRWKPFLSLLILGVILVFLGRALFAHWHDVSTLKITAAGWACLTIATGVTLFAHLWTGMVWGWILRELGQPISPIWAAQAYLKTNIAKYLPSNLLHLYGRTMAAKDQGVPLIVASLSVLLDTMLMAAAGFILGLFCIPQNWLGVTVLGIVCILTVLHPRLLVPLLNRLSASLRSTEGRGDLLPQQLIKRYPLRPLLGELIFVTLRGFGFVLTIAALMPIAMESVPSLISIYGVGWVLGFITPGAPGGLGIFELTVSTLLTQPDILHGASNLPVGIAISAVAVHRLVSTLAEAIGAFLAWADERWPLGFL